MDISAGIITPSLTGNLDKESPIRYGCGKVRVCARNALQHRDALVQRCSIELLMREGPWYREDDLIDDLQRCCRKRYMRRCGWVEGSRKYRDRPRVAGGFVRELHATRFSR